MSVKALPEREPKIKHYGIFIGLGVFGLALTIWVGLQTYYSDKEAIKQQQAMESFQVHVTNQLDDLMKRPNSPEQKEAAKKLKQEVGGPLLSLEPGSSVNPAYAFETRFILSNRGNHVLTKASYFCELEATNLNLHLDKPVNIFPVAAGPIEDLPPNYSRSLYCDFTQAEGLMTKPDPMPMTILVSYTYKEKEGKTTFRFFAMRKPDGSYVWFPKGGPT